MKQQTALFLGLIITLGSCSSLKKGNSSGFDSADAMPLYPVASSASGGHGSVDLGGKWYLKTVGSVTLRGIEDDEWPYVEFSPGESRFYGTDGCNLLNGSYTIADGGALALSEVASTMRLCQNDTLSYPISRALDAVEAYKIANRGGSVTLTLLNGNREAVMTLSKSDIDFINGAWQVVGINGESVNVPEARLIFDTNSATISGCAGCNRVRGEITRNPANSSSLQLVGLATTRMACPDMRTESALLIALEEASSVRKSGGDKIELVNAAGKSVVTLKKLTKEELQ